MSSKRNWSYSRFFSFFTCPRAYHEQYVAKATPTWEPPGMHDGRMFHEFAEDYAQFCFDQGRLAADLNKAASRAQVCDDDGLAGMWYAWAERTEFDWTSVVADGQSIERWCERELPNGDLMRGRLDLVLYDAAAKCIITHDYKSGWAIPEWHPEDPPLQHRCYAWLAMGEWPAAETCVARCEYVRFAHEPIHEWELVPPLDLIPENLVARIERIEKWEREVLDEKSKTTVDGSMVPGTHCGQCKFLLACPLEKTAADIYSDPSRLGEAYDMALALRAKASALMALLKGHHENAGDQYMPDGRLLTQAYPQYAGPDGRVARVKPRMLVRLLTRAEKFGTPAEKLASVKVDKLMKALDGTPEAGLDEFVEPARARGTLKLVEPDEAAPEPEASELPEATVPKPL